MKDLYLDLNEIVYKMNKWLPLILILYILLSITFMSIDPAFGEYFIRVMSMGLFYYMFIIIVYAYCMYVGKKIHEEKKELPASNYITIAEWLGIINNQIDKRNKKIWILISLFFTSFTINLLLPTPGDNNTNMIIFLTEKFNILTILMYVLIVKLLFEILRTRSELIEIKERIENGQLNNRNQIRKEYLEAMHLDSIYKLIYDFSKKLKFGSLTGEQ